MKGDMPSDMPDAVGDYFENLHDEDVRHQTAHLLIGAGATIIAFILLIGDPFGNVNISLERAFFYGAILTTFLYFPLREYIKKETTAHWETAAQIHIITMLSVGLLSAVAIGSWYNTATLTFVFGSVLILLKAGMDYSSSGPERLMYAALFVVALCTIVYHIPWGQAPASVQPYGMAAQSALEPAAQFTRTAGSVAVDCMQTPDQCGERLEEEFDTLMIFIRGIPIIGDAVASALEFKTQRGMTYLAMFQCSAQQGGIAPPDPDPGSTDPGDLPQQNVRECVEERGGLGDDEEDPFYLEEVSVSGSTATATFNRPVDGFSVYSDDFSVSPGSIDQVSVSGSSVNLDLSGMDSVSDGDAVTVTVSGEVAAGDDDVRTSGDSCTANYGEGPSC